MLLPKLHYAVGKTHTHIPLPQQPDTKNDLSREVYCSWVPRDGSVMLLYHRASVTTVVETVVAEPLTSN